MLTPADIQFIQANETADTARLLLGKNRTSEGVQVPLCVKCIEARRKIQEKIPIWHACPELVYPFPLSVEQCSSQVTAQYKQNLAKELSSQTLATLRPNGKTSPSSLQEDFGLTTVDLTGGMGVDSYFLSRIALKHIYIERNPELCAAATWNFRALGATNISVLHAECTPQNRELFTYLATLKPSLIYIDPARRSKTNAKVTSLQEYEPNLLEIKKELLQISPLVLVKISPMADIRQTLLQLPETVSIHVVSVNNECKELLYLLSASIPDKQALPGPVITAIDLCQENIPEAQSLCIRSRFCFTLTEEEQAIAPMAGQIGTYLYEPGKALLKSGAYKLLAQRTGLKKLAPSTHLYTSDTLYTQALPADPPPSNFPGKIFRVIDAVDFNKKKLKQIAREYPCADVSARNFPLDTNGLKKLSGIRDGGEHHLFAVTLANGGKKIIICRKALK